MQLPIYRKGAIVYTVEIGDDTVYKKEIMGAHTITSEFYSNSILNIFIGDYIIFKGENYTINVTPQVQKINATTFAYNVTFEGTVYKLYDKLLMHLGVSDFNYYGSPSDFIGLIVANMNTIDAGWSVAFADVVPPQNIQFTNTSCRQALTQIAEAFKLEYSLSGKAISIVFKVGNVTTLSFQYGKGKGLYTLTRKPIEDADLVTRVYGFGGEKNLDLTYRNGLKRLTFQGAYLENNVATYGVKEGQYTDDTIYPHRTGTVTAVDPASVLAITDHTLNFDVNAQLLSGVTAQISFLTGALTGYTFDINTYDNANKKVYFNQFTDSNDYLLPNTLNKPVVGDTYVLLNIKMPQTYIDAAEAQLKAATQTFLNQNSSPNVTYDLSIDEKFARMNNIEIHVGDEVNIIDADLSVNNNIRCSSVSFPLVNPYLITATIADTITYTVQEKQIAQTINNQQQIITIDRTRQEEQRINSIIYKKMKDIIFDPDGYFKNGDTSSLTVETGMLTVGLPSQNFSIDGVKVEPNYNGDVNSFAISNGTLFHNVYSIAGLGNVWNINGLLISDLDPDKSYYVYARCARSALTGDWMIDEKSHDVEAEIGYWNFNLGILFSVIAGSRAFRFTNGMAYIFGDNVVCGMIKSVDGTQYIDLNHSKFYFGKPGDSIDFDVTNPNTLTIDGALVAKMIFAEDADIQNLRVDTLVTTNPTTAVPNPQRVEIKKATNSLAFYEEGGADPAVKIDLIEDISTGEVTAGLRAGDDSINSQVSLMGVSSNTSNHPFLASPLAVATTNTNTSILGVLVKRKTGAVPGLSAAVSGTDLTTDADGNSQSFGGFFNSLFAGGLSISTKTSVADYTLLMTDSFLVMNANNTAFLPANVAANYYVGKMFMIFQQVSGGYTIDGNGKQLMRNGSNVNAININTLNSFVTVIWTGSFWTFNIHAQ